MAVNETKKNNIEFKLSEFQNGLFKDFEMSIDFFVNQIWEKLIVIEKKEYLFDPESDPKKRWNSFYDLQLIFAAEYENVFGRNTILVTQEGRIRKVFKKYGKTTLVADLDEYENMLKTNVTKV